MKDVKELVSGVFRVQEVSLAVVAGFALGGALCLKRAWPRLLARLVFWGGGLGVGSLAALGLAALLGFDGLFLWFHQVSFRNLFWMLDPRTDYLIRLFPPAFLMDATLLVAGATLLEGVAVAALAWAYLRRLRRSEVAAFAGSGGATGAAATDSRGGS